MQACEDLNANAGSNNGAYLCSDNIQLSLRYNYVGQLLILFCFNHVHAYEYLSLTVGSDLMCIAAVIYLVVSRMSKPWMHRTWIS